MWLHLPDCFLSVVAHRTQPAHLLIRARTLPHLEAFLAPMPARPQIDQTPNADYLYRAVITRNQFASLLSERIRRMEYPNFKAAAAKHPTSDTVARSRYVSALHETWQTNRDLQPASVWTL